MTDTDFFYAMCRHAGDGNPAMILDDCFGKRAAPILRRILYETNTPLIVGNVHRSGDNLENISYGLEKLRCELHSRGPIQLGDHLLLRYEEITAICREHHLTDADRFSLLEEREALERLMLIHPANVFA